MLWTLLLLAIFAIQNNAVVVGLVAAIAPILSVAATIIASMDPKPSWSKIPRWLRSRPPLWAVIVLLVVNVAASVGWPIWSHLRDNQPINAVSLIRLENNDNLLPGEGAATIEVAIEPWRNNASIVLESSDHRPDLGTCRPGTRFDVTPRIAGNPRGTLRVAPGESFDIAIPPSVKSVHLTVTVTNTRQEKNCAIDLSVSEVILANR